MKKEDIIDNIIEYFDGDQLAANVLVDKYFQKDENGNLIDLSVDHFFKRLINEIIRIENNYKNPLCYAEVEELIKDFKFFVLGGSPMFGIGTNSLTSLSNCFVIGSNNNSDSYGSIMRTDEEQIQLMKRRGGVGHDISHLRPAGSLANNSILNGLSGAVLYAERFSNSTREVRQGDRRGALMLTISIKHPDSERFIDSKLDLGKITDANISVKITDDFMNAVINNKRFLQTFPIDLDINNHIGFFEFLDSGEFEYNKLYSLQYTGDNYYKGCYAKVVKAREIWNKIVKNAHQSAEPGVLFWDTVVNNSPSDLYSNFGFKTVSTNPCGEVPLSEYSSCNLGSINLFSLVDEPFTPKATFNFDKLKEVAYKAQKIMDDVIDLEIEKINNILKKIDNDPEPHSIKETERNLWKKVRNTAISGRRTGLGILGVGDTIAAMGLVYGSKESIEFIEEIMKQISLNSYTSSIDMAKDRGCFEVFSSKIENGATINHSFLSNIYKNLPENIRENWLGYGRRNISNLSIAPTGTISLLTQTTSGIEPVFSIRYKRRRRTIDKSKINFTDENGETYQEYYVFHKRFREWYDLNWYKTDVKLFDIDFKKPLEDYTDKEFRMLVSKSPWSNSTANDVDWVSKVKLQGAVQKWVDHAISATTNIPKNTPVSMVNDIYIEAWKSGCKGMTIYRDGSRSGILVTDEVVYAKEIKRNTILECDIFHKTVLKQDWTIVVGLLNSLPYEIFAFPQTLNHIFPQKCQKGFIEKIKTGVYRLTSEVNGKIYEIPNIIDLIDDTGQANTRRFSLMLRHGVNPEVIIEDIQKYALVTSFDKAIQRVLQNYSKTNRVCPECGSELTSQDGCIKCMNCGWSRC